MDIQLLLERQFKDFSSTLRAKEVIEMLGIGQRTFYELMARGELPDCILIGRQKRWLKGVVVAYLATRSCPAVASASAAAKGHASVKNKAERMAGPKSKAQQRKERTEGLMLAAQQDG